MTKVQVFGRGLLDETLTRAFLNEYPGVAREQYYSVLESEMARVWGKPTVALKNTLSLHADLVTSVQTAVHAHAIAYSNGMPPNQVAREMADMIGRGQVAYAWAVCVALANRKEAEGE